MGAADGTVILLTSPGDGAGTPATGDGLTGLVDGAGALAEDGDGAEELEAGVGAAAGSAAGPAMWHTAWSWTEGGSCFVHEPGSCTADPTLSLTLTLHFDPALAWLDPAISL